MLKSLIAGLALALAGLGVAAQPLADEGEPMQAVPLQPGETLRLSGRLDHPAWARAPVYTRFVEKDPNPGAVPPQGTRVQVLFDEQALYIGITALDDTPANIRRSLVRHDQVLRTQDFVVVYIDPIGSRRAAQFFRVGAAGSLGDGLHTAADDSEDFAPDFDWDAAVADHPEGWTAVLRLPFATLRYAAGEQDRWRIMVARRLPRQSYHLVASVLIPREAPSFIDRLQPLQGIRLPAQQGFLTLRPSVTLRRTTETAADGSRRRGNDFDASLDVKWRPRPELVIDATLNPDFSQVALDVPQLSGNTKFALSLAEKRPFFFESADLLRSPTEAFYTRSFTAPRAGLRATWRGSRVAGSALIVDDRGGGVVLLPGAYGTGVAEQPGSRTLAARARLDEGELQWGGVLAARRYEQGRGENTVLGPDLTWALAPQWMLRAQWLHSRSTAFADDGGQLQPGAARDGDRWYARLRRLTEDRDSDYTLEDIGEDFRHDSGFMPQSGVRRLEGKEAKGWRDVGPFHEFWLNVHALRTEARRGGRSVEQQFYPGFWGAGAHNIEWFADLHLLGQLRATPEGPLLSQRYLTTGLIISPAAWLPLLDVKIDAGRLADTDAQRLRPGVRGTLTAKLRLLPALEIEPTWFASWLRGAEHGETRGPRAYDERLVNLLAVWHLGPRSHLRAIVQRDQLARAGARLGRSQQTSLVYSHRASSGTVLYAGASRASEGVAARRRGSEVFVKLQVDLDEARRWYAGS